MKKLNDYIDIDPTLGTDIEEGYKILRQHYDFSEPEGFKADLVEFLSFCKKTGLEVKLRVMYDPEKQATPVTEDKPKPKKATTKVADFKTEEKKDPPKEVNEGEKIEESDDPTKLFD